MKTPRVPPIAIGGIATLPDCFNQIVASRGLTQEEAEKLIALLPQDIHDAPCFFDLFTNIWRYDFGDLFDLGGEGIVIGTHMYQPVERLFDVMRCAIMRLSSSKLPDFLKRLSNQDKHEDTLVEFVPILRLSSDITVEYEVEGCGEGNSKIDWLISDSNSPSILLDVKNRSRDLLEGLFRIRKGERNLDGTAPAPTHDTALLFRNLESKFKAQQPTDFLQGAWIKTELKQEESEICKSFECINTARVHFAILGDWSGDVYFLSREPWIKERLSKTLCLKTSERFVFNRGK